MKRFFTFLKTELKLSLRDMNIVIFAVMMPLIVFVILGIVNGTKPAYDGAAYTFLEQSFGAVGAIAVCASGLMGLPLAISGLREMKILKRLRVTPARPVFLLGVELTMYVIYCAVSLAALSVVALFWGVRLHGSLPAFLGSWSLTMLSTLSIGMLVGGIEKDTKQASLI
ncbi:MAG TPA: ABC transporter permease, partial [Clostridiales bacterium]|nr:ABC transporter permease [Clostridiales bacterium]